MAITLITGVPGSGKTLLAVQAIAEQVKKNRDPKTPPEDRRPIYTDIDGIDFGTDVEFYDGDWRLLPDGSLVVYDEVHRRWPATGRSGMSSDETCSQLDTHRHRGFDFILITQWPTKLHFEARTNVTIHKHLVRISGSHNATIYTWQQAEGAPDSRESKDKADTEPFRYPKQLFEHYKSATIHTHKLHIPKKIIFFAVLLFIVLALLYRNISSNDSALIATFANSEPEPPPQQETFQISQLLPSAGGEATPAAQAAKLIILGCISNSRTCHCYDESGKVIKQEFLDCLTMAENPLPFPLKLEDS